ncbi:Uma2 family endonuclease [Streptomonospora sp. S1-112]|uniref:Uma2 family endonuclease n=2 Tax=Streptomonospora mangrovi TaxID=2883123 RepID=A0A9X3NWU5_9ACTN|nr:Uma2 family endonuclease [Streptomonospora mangrovi]MDA0565761.1 Uma2 family endonuclease [Streptomonospora mangrovi]
MSIGRSDPRPLTVADLERMPDDGRRYELVDGRLDVSPAPVSVHSQCEGRLVTYLNIAARGRFEAYPGAGITLNAEGTHHRIPDVAVVRAGQVEHPYLTTPPVLAVEVVSPESRLRDLHTKRREYAEFGIDSYWIVTPALDKPGITELRLREGVYRETAQVFGEDVLETDAPFPLRIVPHWLIAPGMWIDRIGGD